MFYAIRIMAIDKEIIKKVARISRIELTDKEVESFTKDFNNILRSFETLDEIKKLPEPSFHPILIEDVTREDLPEKSFSQEEALANSKNKENGFFKGPRAV
jgi:aspartyl-tRNA(Asn)/glutamyl-tRNA(Gln) amidotransferase subunit C